MTRLLAPDCYLKISLRKRETDFFLVFATDVLRLFLLYATNLNQTNPGGESDKKAGDRNRKGEGEDEDKTYGV